MHVTGTSGVDVPVVETRRLRLRGHRITDFAECAAMWGDPSVTRYVGGVPYTHENTWSKMLRYVGHWALLGFGYWLVEERDSKRFVGEVGFADFRRDITPSLDGTPEAGWVLASWAHGRGFATEAMHAALEWGAKPFAGSDTVSLIHPDNRSSLRVADKCGFVESVRTTYKGEPTVVLRRSANVAPIEPAFT